MAEVRYDEATRIYDRNDRPAVDRLDLHIRDGEFLVLVGPSGCGKSTALRMLAGLEDVDEGEVHIGGVDVTRLPPKVRDVAMVFQNFALYPHMTVAANMGYALKIARVRRQERARRVQEVAALLDLTPYLDRKPAALSGGQRQRVAMGRAIIREPQVFLMDEPLSNLDAKLRVQTRSQIAQLQRRLGVTTVYVTHDQVEAMTMGDRVAVMRDGLLQQVDTPRRVYDAPANTFVAGFLGSPPMNLVEADVTDAGLVVGDVRWELTGETAAAVRGERRVVAGVRPEHWRLVPAEHGLPVVVDLVEELGADSYVYGHASVAGERLDLVVRHSGGRAPAQGEVLHVGPASVHVFSVGSGDRLVAA